MSSTQNTTNTEPTQDPNDLDRLWHAYRAALETQIRVADSDEGMDGSAWDDTEAAYDAIIDAYRLAGYPPTPPARTTAMSGPQASPPYVTITRVPRLQGYCPLCEILPNFESITPETVLEVIIGNPHEGRMGFHFCDAHWAQVLHALSAATP